MADDSNNMNEGVGLPEDLRRLMARAEEDASSGEEYDPDAPDETGEEEAEEEEDEDDWEDD